MSDMNSSISVSSEVIISHSSSCLKKLSAAAFLLSFKKLRLLIPSNSDDLSYLSPHS